MSSSSNLSRVLAPANGNGTLAPVNGSKPPQVGEGPHILNGSQSQKKRTLTKLARPKPYSDGKENNAMVEIHYVDEAEAAVPLPRVQPAMITMRQAKLDAILARVNYNTTLLNNLKESIDRIREEFKLGMMELRMAKERAMSRSDDSENFDSEIILDETTPDEEVTGAAPSSTDEVVHTYEISSVGNEGMYFRGAQMKKEDDAIPSEATAGQFENEVAQLENEVVQAQPKQQIVGFIFKSDGQDSEKVQLGAKGTEVRRGQLKNVNFADHIIATRKLLVVCCTRETLATRSLSGKPSPAFKNREPKPALDEAIVADIIEVVTKYSGCTVAAVRAAITSKCADEAKMMRQKAVKALVLKVKAAPVKEVAPLKKEAPLKKAVSWKKAAMQELALEQYK